MRKIIFFIIFLILLAIFIGFKVQSTQQITLVEPTPTAEPTISAEKLMSVVNDWRYTQGFQPYTKSEILCSFASKRLPEIEASFSHKGYFEHVYTDLPLKTYSAENLSQGYSDTSDLLQAWLNSPEHRKNLDADYRYSCMKCDKNYCVEIFANYSQ